MTVLFEHGKLTGFTLFYNPTRHNWQMSTSVDKKEWDVRHISEKEALHLLAEIDEKIERQQDPVILKGRFNFKPKGQASQPAAQTRVRLTEEPSAPKRERIRL